MRLQEDKFLAMEIALPFLADQRRVVARIDGIARRIAEARTLRQVASDEVEALSRATTEAAYQDLVAGAGVCNLDDLCESITDGDHNTPTFTDTGVRFIFVGNVSTGRLHFQNSKRVDESYFRGLSPLRVPRRGDILYSAVGATLGVPALVDSDEPFCFQRHVAILKPHRDRLDARFAWHMLRSRSVFDAAWSSSTGSAQPTIPLRAIRALQIPVPSLVAQRRIAEEMDGLCAGIDALRAVQAEGANGLAALLPAVLDQALLHG